MATVAPILEDKRGFVDYYLSDYYWYGYGFGFNPFKAVKKLGKKIVKGAKHIVKVAKHHPLESVAAIAAISSPFWLPAVGASAGAAGAAGAASAAGAAGAAGSSGLFSISGILSSVGSTLKDVVIPVGLSTVGQMYAQKQAIKYQTEAAQDLYDYQMQKQLQYQQQMLQMQLQAQQQALKQQLEAAKELQEIQQQAQQQGVNSLTQQQLLYLKSKGYEIYQAPDGKIYIKKKQDLTPYLLIGGGLAFLALIAAATKH